MDAFREYSLKHRIIFIDVFTEQKHLQQLPEKKQNSLLDSSSNLVRFARDTGYPIITVYFDKEALPVRGAHASPDLELNDENLIHAFACFFNYGSCGFHSYADKMTEFEDSALAYVINNYDCDYALFGGSYQGFFTTLLKYLTDKQRKIWVVNDVHSPVNSDLQNINMISSKRILKLVN